MCQLPWGIDVALNLEAIEKVLLDPAIERAWEELLSSWTDAEDDRPAKTLAWCVDLRDEAMGHFRDVFDPDDLETCVMWMHSSLKMRWSIQNTRAQYQMASGGVDPELMYRNALLSNLIRNLEGLLQFRDVEYVTAAIAEPIARLREERYARVPLDRLDTVLQVTSAVLSDSNRVSFELDVIAKDREQARRRGYRRRASDNRFNDFQRIHSRFSHACRDLVRRITALQNNTVGHAIFRRLEQVVDAECEAHDRSVRVTNSGAEIQAPAEKLDALVDPLITLVRFLVQRSIETPDEREAAGKSRTGVISMTAHQLGDGIELHLTDNGRAFDVEPLLDAAEQAGTFSREHFNSLPREARIGSLIDALGQIEASDSEEAYIFATLHVHEAIQAVQREGHEMVVLPNPDCGLTLRVRLENNLTFVEAMMIRVHDEVFGVPLHYVAEIVECPREQVVVADGVPVVEIRGRCIPLISAARALSLPESETSKLNVVIIEGDAGRFGLIVDDLDGIADAELKPIVGADSRKSLFAGAMLKRDNTVGLVLNPAVLAQTTSGYSDSSVPVADFSESF